MIDTELLLKIDNDFIIFVNYIFGDWWVWFRFTITAVLLRKIASDAIVGAPEAFWSWATKVFRKDEK